MPEPYSLCNFSIATGSRTPVDSSSQWVSPTSHGSYSSLSLSSLSSLSQSPTSMSPSSSPSHRTRPHSRASSISSTTSSNRSSLAVIPEHAPLPPTINTCARVALLEAASEDMEDQLEVEEWRSREHERRMRRLDKLMSRLEKRIEGETRSRR